MCLHNKYTQYTHIAYTMQTKTFILDAINRLTALIYIFIFYIFVYIKNLLENILLLIFFQFTTTPHYCFSSSSFDFVVKYERYVFSCESSKYNFSYFVVNDHIWIKVDERVWP